MAVKCGWASIDERGRASGGKAGDQTGNEVKTGSWYDFGQNYVLRFKNRTKAKKAAKLMRQICASNKIGYDQNQRTSLYEQMKKHGYDVSKISKCETDCSATIAVCVNGVGIKVSKDIYTGNMVDALMKTGQFKKYYTKKYTEQDSYLKTGDIIVATTHHVIMALENGSRVTKKVGIKSKKRKKDTYEGAIVLLKKHSDGSYLCYGDQSVGVNYLQKFLNWYSTADLTVDGIFGENVQEAVEFFQKNEKLSVDAIFGAKCLKRMKAYRK
jgi:peptidoglycan hydrolase-like protein with peptidoglycan-binding domain